MAKGRCYRESDMKKPQLAKRLARRSGVTAAEAADSLDRIVHHILDQVRRGQPAPLLGFGKFKKDANGRMSFEQETGDKHE